MKKWLLIVLAVLLCAEPAYAQNPNVLTPSPQTLTTQSSGVTDCTRNTTCAFWDIGQQRSASIQVSGTFSGTMTFEATSDGSNWNTVTLTKLADATAVTTATAAGQYSIVNSGIWLIRARATTWASGTANLTAVLGNGTIPLIPVGSEAPASATFWLATANAALPNAKVLGALGTGLVFNTTTTGTPTVVVCATAGTVLQGGAPPTCTANPVVDSVVGSGGQSLVVSSANVTEIRNGTSAQSLYVYNTYSSAGVNYERGEFKWTSNTLQIGTTAAGTGSNQFIQMAPGGTATWRFHTDGSLRPLSANAYDVATSAIPARTGYFGTSTAVGSNSGSTSATNFNFGTANTGIYADAANVIRYSIGGTRIGQWGSNGLSVLSDTSGLQFGASSDMAMRRGGAAATLMLSNSLETTGVVLNVGTDSVLRNYGRDGSTLATFQTGVVVLGSNSANSGTTRYANNDAGIKYRNAANSADLLAMYTNGSNALLIGNDNGFTGGVTVGSASAAVTIPSVASVSGVNYVCASTTGLLSKNNTACVGTDAEAIASIPELRRQLADLAIQVIALSQFKFSPSIR